MSVHDEKTLYGAGIVLRLRLVSAVIIVLLLLKVVVSGHLLARLERLRSITTDRLVPALALSSELQARIADIYLLSDRMPRIQRYRELDTLERLAADTFGPIRHTIEKLRERRIDSLSLDRLSAAVDDIARDADTMTQLTRQIVVRRNTLDAASRKLSSLREDLRLLIDPALDEATVAHYRGLQPAYAGRSLEPAEREAVRQAEVWRSTLMEISRRVAKIVDLSTALTQPGTDPDTVPLVQDRLRFELRSLPATIAPLAGITLHRQIGETAARLNTLIIGENQLLAQLEKLETESEETERLRIALNEYVGEISTAVGAVVANIEHLTDETVATFDRASSTMLIALGAIGILTIGTILIAGYLVVERQIGRRMNRLAQTVLEIAAGDTDTPVDIDGRDEIGEIARSLQVFKDNAHELRRSNEELERFAYAAAHDMRSPLRSIESLAEWTLEDERDTLSAEGEDNLKTLLARARRLATLQNDLLDYARAGEIDGSLSDVDIEELVAELGAMLDPDGNFDMSVRGAPLRVHTHAVPLRQIVLNLLNNAIKHHDRSSGALVVDVSWRDERVHVSISDDGPGIEPRFHERIFGLFQTLRSKDEVEGSGLGLSMVHKLVERYGGRIVVTSDPERVRGTTFTFDLPTRTCASAQVLKKAA